VCTSSPAPKLHASLGLIARLARVALRLDDLAVNTTALSRPSLHALSRTSFMICHDNEKLERES
jgi:hypothetical protein